MMSGMRLDPSSSGIGDIAGSVAVFASATCNSRGQVSYSTVLIALSGAMPANAEHRDAPNPSAPVCAQHDNDPAAPGFYG